RVVASLWRRASLALTAPPCTSRRGLCSQRSPDLTYRNDVGIRLQFRRGGLPRAAIQPRPARPVVISPTAVRGEIFKSRSLTWVALSASISTRSRVGAFASADAIQVRPLEQAPHQRGLRRRLVLGVSRRRVG